MKWEQLDNQSQVYLYWEYYATIPETERISFSEYAEMMAGFTFE